MLVLTSVRKIGAVIFLAAITIAPLTHMVAIIAFWSRVSDLFALAALTERARAELLSMTGCFAHRAVLCAARVVRSMRFRATVSAYHEWSTLACDMSDCLAFATLAERA